MNVVDLLERERSGVLDEASARLERSDATYDGRPGEAFTQEALAELFDLVLGAVRARRLTAVGARCEELTRRWFDGGRTIVEVQTAFNTLERLMWERVVAGLPPEDHAEALGLLSTVFGFGKDALTQHWVLLTSGRRGGDLSAVPSGARA